MKTVLGALACVTLLSACRGGEAAPAAFRPLARGDTVPAYVTASLAGDTVRLGGAPVGAGTVTLVNVWATWCESCREEMQDLQALSREFGPRGARVVGVSVDLGDGARVRRFVENEQLTFTVAHDPEQRIQRAYRVVGVPQTFIVGRDGTLLWTYVGNIRPVLDSVRGMLARSQ